MVARCSDVGRGGGSVEKQPHNMPSQWCTGFDGRRCCDGHKTILFRNGDLTLALAVAVAAGESVTFIKKFMPRSPTKPNTRKLVRLAIL